MPGAYGNVFSFLTSNWTTGPGKACSNTSCAKAMPLKLIAAFTSAINSTGVLLMSILVSMSASTRPCHEIYGGGFMVYLHISVVKGLCRGPERTWIVVVLLLEETRFHKTAERLHNWTNKQTALTGFSNRMQDGHRRLKATKPQHQNSLHGTIAGLRPGPSAARASNALLWVLVSTEMLNSAFKHLAPCWRKHWSVRRRCWTPMLGKRPAF